MKLALKNDSYFFAPEGEINVSVIVAEDRLGLEFDSATTANIRVQQRSSGFTD
jgi:hypothetical protein